MNYQNNRISILIVGATGRLGTFLTKHCIAQPKLLVNILVRDPQKNKELAESVEKAGGKVWKGDICQPETLDEPTKGVHTVLCLTSSFDLKTCLDGQKALIDAAVKNGVKRFSPSDYGENVEKFSREELRNIGLQDCKASIMEYLKTQPIKTIVFAPGVIVDAFFHWTVKELAYWGNSDLVYNMTTYEDTAKYVAAALIDENRTGHYNFSTDKLTVKEIADVYNQVRGANIAPVCKGTFEELRKAYDEAKKTAPTAFPTIILGLCLTIYDERSGFDKIHNSEFPDVKTTSVKEFLERNPNIKIGEPHN